MEKEIKTPKEIAIEIVGGAFQDCLEYWQERNEHITDDLTEKQIEKIDYQVSKICERLANRIDWYNNPLVLNKRFRKELEIKRK